MDREGISDFPNSKKHGYFPNTASHAVVHFSTFLTIFEYSDCSQDRTVPSFAVIFSQTALRKKNPCTQDIIKRTGLFCAKVRWIANG
jgi:hypothetical protein